jgi:hypothetical protein
MKVSSGGCIRASRRSAAVRWGLGPWRSAKRETHKLFPANSSAREKGLGLWGPDPAPVNPRADEVVYVTKTGKAYHHAGCRSLDSEATATCGGSRGSKKPRVESRVAWHAVECAE